tara:strand:- start:5417 stop:6844 length:1428 start_codon:yes stop_codon:yes gene_type:complete
MKKIAHFFLLFAITVSFGQTPCENGMAGEYPCNGYDLLFEMTASAFGSDNANDSWGWTDPETGSEYALIGLDDGTAFLNIDDPINPVYLGRLDTHTVASLWRDVKTYGNYAFIVSEASGHGMQVFDLTRLRDVVNPPLNFTEDAHYSGFGNAHNLVINENSGYAYGVGTQTYNGGPHFVDISTPLYPKAAGGFATDSYSHDGQVITYNGPDTDHTGKEIYIGSNTSFISIVDITDKSNPQSIANVTYPNTVYTHQGWFTEDHRYFILGDEIDEINFGFNTRSIVFDFEDLDNPQLHFEYDGPTAATDHNGYVKDDIYYLANYTAGIRMIDISDIENQNFEETGFFDVYPSGDTAGYNGAWNVYPYFESGTLLVSTLRYSDQNFTPGMLLIRDSSLATPSVNTMDVSVYPNPASDTVTIDALDQDVFKIEVFDIAGKLLFETQETSALMTLGVSQFTQGVYFLKINDSLTKKLIVE